MIGLYELLKNRGLDSTKKIKIIRHQDPRFDIQELEQGGFIELYQSYQTGLRFNCEYLISTIGQEFSKAPFFGVYRVCGSKRAQEVPIKRSILKRFPAFATFTGPNEYFFELAEEMGYDDLKARVIIDWGRAALSFCQWLSNGKKVYDKEVLEVLPTGYVREFPGYDKVLITFDEMTAILDNPMAHREWHRMLSAVAGVYLIVDLVSGLQYVGSAYGQGGILARWRTYAITKHGGNLKLRLLLEKFPQRFRSFQFSVLQPLSRTLSKNEVIAHERHFMKKLGSRAFGHNS